MREADPPTANAQFDAKGQPTILVVDDEQALLKLMVLRLKAIGWTIYAASDGASAIRIAEELKCRLNVLLTDIQMPGMPGDALIRHIRQLCPYVDVLAITGALPSGHAEGLPNIPYLKKPFAMDHLVGTIQNILAAQV